MLSRRRILTALGVTVVSLLSALAAPHIVSTAFQMCEWCLSLHCHPLTYSCPINTESAAAPERRRLRGTLLAVPSRHTANGQKLFSCTSSSSTLDDQPRRPSAASSSSYSSSIFGRSPGHLPAEWPQNYHRQHAAHSSHRPGITHNEPHGQQLQEPFRQQSSPLRDGPGHLPQLELARRQSSHGQLGVSPVEAHPAYAVPMSGRMPVPGLPMQQVYIPPSTMRGTEVEQRHELKGDHRLAVDARTKKRKEEEDAQMTERMMDW